MAGPIIEPPAPVILERVKVAARAALGPQAANDLEVQVAHMLDLLVIQLRTHIYAERLTPIVKHAKRALPRSPWQGYKWRWFPHTRLGRLILRVFPVRRITTTATFTVERLRTFPDNKTVFPEEFGQSVALYQYTDPEWTDPE